MNCVQESVGYADCYYRYIIVISCNFRYFCRSCRISNLIKKAPTVEHRCPITIGAFLNVGIPMFGDKNHQAMNNRAHLYAYRVSK